VSIGMAGALALRAGTEQASATPPRYFLLESYLLQNGSQGQRLAGYMQRARIGMAGRLQTVAPAFVLEALIAAHMPQVLAVSAFASLEELAGMKRKLREDAGARQALAEWESGEEPAYEELDETVLEAAAYCPPLPGPAQAPDRGSKPPRVFELRTYHSPTERQLRALHERFAGAEIGIFHRCGIHPVLYSSTLIGANKPNLTYLMPFDDLAAREKAWAAFGADPEWVKVRADSIAKHGQISSVSHLSLFKAATYSPVR
jgi:hypothetical protein